MIVVRVWTFKKLQMNSGPPCQSLLLTHPSTDFLSPLLFSQWTGVIITMASRSLYHFGINTCCSEAERTDAASLQLSLITSGFVVVRCNTDIIRVWTIRRGRLSHRESVSLNLRAKTRDTQMIWGQRDLTKRWDIQKEKTGDDTHFTVCDFTFRSY